MEIACDNTLSLTLSHTDIKWHPEMSGGTWHSHPASSQRKNQGEAGVGVGEPPKALFVLARNWEMFHVLDDDIKPASVHQQAGTCPALTVTCGNWLRVGFSLWSL